MTPELSICVPTLRGYDRVTRLANSVHAHTSHIDYEIVIVDCGSRARGYTQPTNQAMSAGRAPYLLAANDDIELAAGWAEPLLDAVHAGAWCATPDATGTDGPQIFAPYCMLWRASAWAELGGLDEQFVHWCSDIDIARRLVDAGHPPVRIKLPDPIIHALGATSREHPGGFRATCLADLDRFRAKWGVDAEAEKHRLAALAVG